MDLFIVISLTMLSKFRSMFGVAPGILWDVNNYYCFIRADYIYR
jgi:hypothetical protein